MAFQFNVPVFTNLQDAFDCDDSRLSEYFEVDMESGKRWRDVEESHDKENTTTSERPPPKKRFRYNHAKAKAVNCTIPRKFNFAQQEEKSLRRSGQNCFQASHKSLAEEVANFSRKTPSRFHSVRKGTTAQHTIKAAEEMLHPTQPKTPNLRSMKRVRSVCPDKEPAAAVTVVDRKKPVLKPLVNNTAVSSQNVIYTLRSRAVTETPNRIIDKQIYCRRVNPPSATVPKPFKVYEESKRMLVLKEEKIRKVVQDEKDKAIFKASLLPSLSPKGIPKVVKAASTEPKPYVFRSDLRGAVKQQSLRKKLSEQVANSKKLAKFHAKPCRVVSQPPFAPLVVHREPTEPQPFLMHCELRAGERQQFEQRRKMREEANSMAEKIRKGQMLKKRQKEIQDERKSREFHSMPVRSYQEVKVVGSTKKLCQPKSPNFSRKF